MAVAHFNRCKTCIFWRRVSSASKGRVCAVRLAEKKTEGKPSEFFPTSSKRAPNGSETVPGPHTDKPTSKNDSCKYFRGKGRPIVKQRGFTSESTPQFRTPQFIVDDLEPVEE